MDLTNPITFLISNPDKSKYICQHIKERTYTELAEEWQKMYDQVIDYLKEQRQQSDLLLELVKATEEYNQILSDECSEVCSMAYGWASTRVEAGKVAREKVKALKESFAEITGENPWE